MNDHGLVIAMKFSTMPDELEQSATFTEKLVAYLDGELPEAAARDVEQSLASDPEVRAEVEKLNRAWELLDLLPRPMASGEFNSRTLATLKTADLPTDLNSQKASLSSTKRLIVWATGLLLVAVLSFVLGRQAQRTSSDPLLDDLPLVENLDLYREIGDAEFLRELKRKRLLDDRHPLEHR